MHNALPADDCPPVPSARTAPHTLLHALSRASYEVLPLGNAEHAITGSVPRTVPLSVTMTVSKGMEATLDLTGRLADHGYTVTPHLAARMFCNSTHLGDVVARLAHHGIDSIFVIAGDITEPVGQFTDSAELLDQLAELNHPFKQIGIGGYPEGHAHISDHVIDEVLARKAQYATYIVTQMCFRGATTAAWAHRLRQRGIALPIHVGLPGAVTRQTLARISARLGLGPSARFLLRQDNMLWRFFLPGGYRPDRIVDSLTASFTGTAPAANSLHFFTFNEVARTETWRQSLLTRLYSRPLRRGGTAT